MINAQDVCATETKQNFSKMADSDKAIYKRIMLDIVWSHSAEVQMKHVNDNRGFVA